MSLISLDDKFVSTMAVTPEAEAILDLILRGGEEHDAPHVVFKAKKPMGSKSLKLLLDYIPRKDIIQDLAYFDKYFKDYNAPVSGKKDCVECTHIPTDFEIADSLITRMLRSPFAYEVTIHGPNQQELAYELACKHFDQWLHWTASYRDGAGGDDQERRDKINSSNQFR